MKAITLIRFLYIYTTNAILKSVSTCDGRDDSGPPWQRTQTNTGSLLPLHG